MKHDLFVTLVLIFLFLGAHIIGLFVVKNYIPSEQQLPLGIEKPQFNERTSYIPITIALIVTTIIALILIKFAAFRLWKLWFFLSIFFTLTVAFAAFIPEPIAIPLSLLLAVWKTFKPNVLIHNFTELFVYGGLAAVFVPVLNLWSVVILLLIISVYDMVAVWKTKHMISMAKFQAKSRLFAGLFVPYKAKAIAAQPIPATKTKSQKKVYKEAILGGGDIAFSLLFSGVILKTFGFPQALLVSFVTAISLFLLFLFADKKKFYPAMPFVTVGCLLGYLLVRLIF